MVHALMKNPSGWYKENKLTFPSALRRYTRTHASEALIVTGTLVAGLWIWKNKSLIKNVIPALRSTDRLRKAG
jgi:hypothetical protein